MWHVGEATQGLAVTIIEKETGDTLYAPTHETARAIADRLNGREAEIAGLRAELMNAYCDLKRLAIGAYAPERNLTKEERA